MDKRTARTRRRVIQGLVWFLKRGTYPNGRYFTKIVLSLGGDALLRVERDARLFNYDELQRRSELVEQGRVFCYEAYKTETGGDRPQQGTAYAIKTEA